MFSTGPWAWALAASIGVLLAGLAQLPWWRLAAVGVVLCVRLGVGFGFSNHRDAEELAAQQARTHLESSGQLGRVAGRERAADAAQPDRPEQPGRDLRQPAGRAGPRRVRRGVGAAGLHGRRARRCAPQVTNTRAVRGRRARTSDRRGHRLAVDAAR